MAKQNKASVKRCYQCKQEFTPAKSGDWCCADCLEDYRASTGKDRKPFAPGKVCYRCRQDFTPEKADDWCCANCLANYRTSKYLGALRGFVQFADDAARGKARAR